MMAAVTSALEQSVRKFEFRAPLSASERKALLSLPHQRVIYEVNRYLVREGARNSHTALILNGLAFRQKLMTDGARQIVSIHVPGDFVDLEGTLLGPPDYNVQALTRCEVALVPSAAILKLADEHPRIARALWIATLVDAAIFREWIVNVGQREARARLAHLFCEFGCRLELAGLSSRAGYQFPMTQEQLADCTGLTSVHINRTLRALEKDGLIKRQRGFVEIPDWERLRQIAGFNDHYLHLDQIEAAHGH